MQKKDSQKLLNCPFCGGEAYICGDRYRQYFDGEWYEEEGERYWVQTRCKINCIYGNTQAKAFGVVGGIEYTTPEAAAEAWNRRATDA